MKRFAFHGTFLAAIALAYFVAAQEKPKPAVSGTKAAAQKSPLQPGGAQKAKAAVTKTSPPKVTPAPAVVPKLTPDEEAVLQSSQALAKACNQHEGKAFAAVFTADGEYIDETGAVFHGRKSIEEEFTRFFAANPETGIEVQLESARTIAPGVVSADGATRFSRSKDAPPVTGRCTLVSTKEGGKWLIASLRESRVPAGQSSHHEQVRQLEFLVGEWIDEGSDSHVHFNCRWDEGLNYLVRDFAVHMGGQKTMTGTQRIGYDPLTGHLKAWIFDSAGGYAEGYFHSEGDRWILQTQGVTADGSMASGTQIFAADGRHRLTWQAVDYVIGGERIPDIAQVTIVRKPPAPSSVAK